MSIRINLPPAFLQQICLQAEKEYPNECCGIILGPANQPNLFTRLEPCRNVQEECHRKDPAGFPRTSQTAYFIDPKDLFRIQKQARENQEEIRVIYHSHINAEAYFSTEDKRIAAPEGEPAYPGIIYMIVSVMKGKAHQTHWFHWDSKLKDFVLSD